jgi:hypothetical protein
VPGANGHLTVGARLMADPIVKSVSYFDNDRYRTTQYTGPLWELQPIEVRPRAEPVAGTETLPAIESDVLADELGGNGLAALRIWLRQNQLALITSRDVTVRADRQQDFDLKIAWSAHQTATPGSTPKEIGWLQLFEGRQLRGFDWDGRRVLARPIASALNPPEPAAPSGAVKLGDDGSMAAFVPARRAPQLADDRSRRNAGGARALLADVPAGRDPRLHQLPRREHARRVRRPDPVEPARGAARAGGVVARRGVAGAGAGRARRRARRTARALYSFVFSFDSFSRMKPRMSSAMSSSFAHCSL